MYPSLFSYSKHRGCSFNRHLSVSMDFQYHGVCLNPEEFGPLQHPMEPQDVDRPVKCPIPPSSLINGRKMGMERMLVERFPRRTELATMMDRGGAIVFEIEDDRGRSTRKRHHRLSNGHEDQTTAAYKMFQPLDKHSSSNAPPRSSF